MLRQTQDTLQKFASDATGIPFVWLDDNAPRPRLPYGTLRITSLVTLGNPFFGEVDEDGYQRMIVQVQFTLGAQIYGVDVNKTTTAKGEAQMMPVAENPAAIVPVDPVSKALALKIAAQSDSATEVVRRAGLAFWDDGPIMDVAALFAAEREPRASVDFMMRMAIEARDLVGWIETVELTGTYKEPGGRTVATVETELTLV